MKYILHIGTHKTGSTALQHFLFVNRAKLLAKSVLYPLVGLKGNAHHEVAWLARSGNQGRIEEMLHAVEVEAAAAGAEHVVLSSEEFEFIRNRNALSPIFARKPAIVLFVRRQDSYLESEYNQHIRMYSLRFAHDVYRFYYRHDFMPRFNYRYVCNLWEPLAEERSIEVINYDNCLKDRHGIFKEFLGRIGVDWDDEFIIPEDRESNISIPSWGTIYLARMNRRQLSPAMHQYAIGLMVREFEGSPKRPLLSLDDRMVLWKRFASTNEFIYKQYGMEPFTKPGESSGSVTPLDFCEDFDQLMFNRMAQEIQERQAMQETMGDTCAPGSM